MVDRSGGGNVSLSVVIPVYNDPDGIRTTVNAVADQDLSTAEYEVIVVDNDLDDGTRDVIEELHERYSDRVRVTEETDVQSSYAARNEGVKASNGGVISFLDSDMKVDRDWARRVLDAMRENGWDYMGVEVELFVEDGEPSVIERYDMARAFDVESYLQEYDFAPTSALTTRDEVFRDVGLFDERFVSAGDHEWGTRVSEAGYTQHYCPDITVYHPARATFRELFGKYVRIGRGLAQSSRHYPERMDATDIGVLHSGFYVPPDASEFHEDRYGIHPGTRELLAFYVVYYFIQASMIAGIVRERYWP